MKMMTPKNWLAAVSALAFMAGAAHAGGNFADVEQSGTDNDAVVTQSSGDNFVGRLDQEGYRNKANLTQQGGDGNHAGTISQQGAANRITLTFSGANNGTTGFSPGLLAGTSAFARLTQGNVTQTGIDNRIENFVVEGDRNAFGFNQNGLLGNRIGGAVTGSDNQFGVYQSGIFDTAAIGVSGVNNEIYISQDGSFNTAVANASGGGNGILVAQRDNGNSGRIDIAGGANLVKLAQNGGAVIGNNASVAIVGTGNHADIDQTKSGFGGANSLALDIFGSENNNNPFLTAFGGAALLAAQGTGLEPGLIRQIGSGNSITLNVGKPNSDSNGNVFAFLQDGGYNTIEGSVSGSSNQVVVVQTGSSNFTSFSQSGSFNIIGVSQ